MASKQLQTRCPSNLEQKVAEYRDANDLNDSEAMRQLLDRGVRDWKRSEPRGLWLVRQATGVAAVSALISGVLTITSLPGLASGFWALLAVAIVFGSIWAAVIIFDSESDFL